MHHLVEASGTRLFPKGMRLLSHWNLRDEIKANYADKTQGLTRQRMIQQVMERIVTQTIPKAAVNSPLVDWNPFTNTSCRSTAGEGTPPSKVVGAIRSRIPDTRVLLKTFRPPVRPIPIRRRTPR